MTDAEAEALILWLPDVKSQLIGKNPDAGKDWGQEKGTTEDEMVGWHHWPNGHEFSKLQDIMEDREAWWAAVHGSPRVGHDMVTIQQQQLIAPLLLPSCSQAAAPCWAIVIATARMR